MKHEIEFIEDGHIYLVDGVIIPSVTQILKRKFGHKYDFVNRKVLSAAAERGTAVHKAIEEYCKEGKESDIPELYNFKFLCERKNIAVKGNEMQIALEDDNGDVIAAGTLDLLVEIDGQKGIGDIKTTSKLDKEYLAYQLNLYKRGYEQTYEDRIDFLFGLHLRGDTRRYVDIPVNWDVVKEILNVSESDRDES